MRGDGPDQIARDVEGEVDRALGRRAEPASRAQGGAASGSAAVAPKGPERSDGAQVERSRAPLGREAPMSDEGPDQPALVEREVRLFVSRDTEALWEALALRMGLETFDALVQVLCLYGAFLVASADLGYLQNLRLDDLGPEAIRAVVHPWLASRVPSAGKGDNDDDGG